jgi:hypothetical protein
MNRKSIVASSIIAGALVFNPSINSYANDESPSEFYETEPNNTYENVNTVTLQPSYNITDEFHQIPLYGEFNSLSDVDWYKVKLPRQRGTVSIKHDYGNDVVNYTVFKKDRSGKLVEYLPNLKESPEEVYVKATPFHENSLNKEYRLRLVFEAIADGKHEPNNYINPFTGEIESAKISNSNTLIESNWANRFDGTDNFLIETDANKGKLNIEVHYPDKEFNFWNEGNLDHYLRYDVYAVKKDGGLKHWNWLQEGMPSKVHTHSIQIDDEELTGDFIISLFF